MQRRPGQPVHRELNGRLLLGFRRVGRLAGLPVHHRGAAVVVGEDRVDAPAHHGVADDHVERHLDVDRGARRPRRHHERGLQFGQFVGVAAAQVAVDRARQVVEVEQPLGAVEALHPVVKRRAQQGMRVGPGRQPAAQPLRRAPSGSRPRSTSVLTDSCGGQRRRGAVAGAVPLGQQRVDVGAPSRRRRRRRSSSPAIACATSAAPRSTSARRATRRIGGPDRFDDVVAQRVRLAVGRGGRPVLDDAARIAVGTRPLDDVLELARGSPTARAAWTPRRPSGDPTAAACPRRG